MMRFHHSVLVAALTVLVAAPAAAQRPSAGFSYDWSLPTGKLKDYTDNDSWLGFTLDLRRSSNYNDRVSVGATLGYYEFYDNLSTGQIQTPQATITGQQYRHVFSVPLMLSAFAYGGGDSYRPRPFIGLNAGVTYLKQTLDIGIFSFTSDAWVVSAMPEVGVVLATSGRTIVNLHARYHLPFGSNDLFSNGGSGASLQYLSIGLGFMGRPY